MVIGAGSIGLLTLHAVKAVAPDCHVMVLARHAQQANAARGLGADEVIVGGDVYAEMARLTGAKAYRAPLNRGMLLGGFERVYDCVGNKNTVTDALRWARAGGAVVMVGYSLDFLKVDLNPVWYQEVDLIGSYVYGQEDWQGRRAHTFGFVIDLMRKGTIRADALITHRFPSSQLPRAVATAMDKRSGAIKVVLTFSKTSER